jgi:hypothetical protein
MDTVIQLLIEREKIQSHNDIIHLETAMTFTGKPVHIDDAAEISDILAEPAKEGFQDFLLEFAESGYIGIVEPDTVEPGKKYRFRVQHVFDEEQGRTLYVAHPLVLQEQEDTTPEITRNIPDPTLYDLPRISRKYYDAKTLNHKIKKGDEFNIIGVRKHKKGDYIANFTRRQRVIIQGSAIPLRPEDLVRVKVLRCRGTQYFVNAVEIVAEQDMRLNLTREVKYK